MAKESTAATQMLGDGKKKTGKKKAGKHKMRAMHIRKASSGGFIAQHEYEPPSEGGNAAPNEEHVVPDVKALQSHVGDNFAEEDQGEGGPTPAAEAES